MVQDVWRIWKDDPEYGELLYRRAIGEMDEMECAKSLCASLTRFYLPGMKVLDVGCGAGHYLSSFKKRLDNAIDYYGIDATAHYIMLARKAHADVEHFAVGDINRLPYPDDSFDLVICCNLILHLPPPPLNAINELIRVAKKHVVIRTVVGQRNYIIKEIRGVRGSSDSNSPDSEIFSAEESIERYNYFNLYTESYFREGIHHCNPHVETVIEKDNCWTSFDNVEASGSDTATHVVNGMQLSGNLLLDWVFILVRK